MDRKKQLQNSKTQQQTDRSALVAVAFQDHLIRSLNLKTNNFNPRKIGLGPAARAKEKKQVKPLIDTGLRRGKKRCEETKPDEEYILDEKPAPLTLAQKLGLVEAPTQLLSETEWKNVKEKSNKREDSSQPCVICKENFGLQQQVLLSCTHVFHRACLQAFERFSGRKTCPMCRKEQYQTRVIHEGALHHRISCATKIQAAWRGYVVRCWYLKIRETNPPKDARLRKKFYEDKLKVITERMIKSCDFNINGFLSEIDRNLEESRNVFKTFDNVFHQFSEEEWDEVQLKAVQRGETDCAICLTSLQASQRDNNSGDSEGKPLDLVTLNTSDKNTNHYSKSRKKGDSHNPGTLKERSEEKEEIVKRKQTVLLSCSHIFHQTCLQTFEELSLTEGNHVCPVCRAVYQKKTVSV